MNDSPAPVRIRTRPTPAHRSRKYLCMVYADDRNAGKIINLVVSWYPHAKRRRKGIPGVWSVFSRNEICEGTGLTLKQYTRAMPVAIECGAVDFVMGGHRGKKAIFMRPTPALTRYLQEATNRQLAEQLRPRGHDGGHNGGHNLIQPSHSVQSVQKKAESPVPGGKGRAADRLPPGQPEHASPGRLVEPQRLPPGETAPCPTGPDDLLSQVRATKAGGLDEEALRAGLMRLLPPRPRKYEHGVWHPSEKYPAWSRWSPEKLVEKQCLYEQYVENWYRAHPDVARRASTPAMTREEAIANGIEMTEEHREAIRRALESLDRPFDEEED